MKNNSQPTIRNRARGRWTSAAVGAIMLTGVMAALLAAPASSQSLAALRDIEAKLLEKRLDEYAAAERRARSAESQYRELRQQLSGVLGDANIRLAELRTLEAQTSLAREQAYLRDREATDLRRDIYSHLERIEEMDTALDGLGPQLTGTWTINFGDDFGSGTVTFRMVGGRADGTYRLGNGAVGKLRGDLVDRNVDLIRYGPGGNEQLQVRGRLSADGTSMRGDWVAKELAEGRNTIGTWSARRTP